jgi:NhaC family Na+:H+ antiporter
MGVSAGLGVPLAYTAGAIVMGAIFGDKLSPLSDTTVLASAVSEVDIFDHVKYMLLTTVPPFVIGIAMYWFLGNGVKGNVQSGQLDLILATIEKTFTLSPMLLLPPIAVLSLALLKKPALPTFAVGIVLAVILAAFTQHVNLKDVSSVLLNGYAKTTGVEIVDKMLLRGGLKSMLGTVALLIAAAVFGAPLRTIGVMEILIAFVRKFSNTSKLFQTGVFFLHGFLFMITGSYYVTFSAFAPMVRPAYDDLGLHRVNLSRVLEDTGTAFAPIVPWSITGAFIATTLNVPTLEFALFAPITYGGMLCALAYIATNYKIAVIETPS